MRKLGAASLASNPLWQTDYDYFLWNFSTGQGRLQRLKSWTFDTPTSLQDFAYTYDLLGNVLSIVNTKANGTQTQSFAYDPLQRLTSSAASGGTQGVYPLESYTYNASSGNLESKAGVGYTYNAAVSCPAGNRVIAHAVSATGGNTYSYDCNGNMIQRVIAGVTYTLGYDAENHLISVTANGLNASFVYDGDGRRVKGTINGVTTTYIGDTFEWTGSTATMKTYYTAGGVRLAVRTGVPGSPGSTLNWLLGDYLGSTNITANSSAIQVGKLLYKPWGEERFSSGTTPTTFKFTGQRQESSFGLYLYGSRWYDSELGRWAQPDSIVPEAAQGVQAWDRYAYVNNSPANFVDPSGHMLACPSESGNGCEGFGPARILETYGYDTDRADETLRKFIRSHENYSFLKDPDLDDTTRYLVSNAQFQVFAEESRMDSWLSSGAGLALSALIIGDGTNPLKGETASTIRGREAHLNYRTALGPGYRYERPLPSGLKPDAIDWQNNIVRELKPDNPNAIQRGWNQVRKYLTECVNDLRQLVLEFSE